MYGCSKKHKNWFVVEEERARRVVRMWALFAVLDPYNEEEPLNWEWGRRLESVDYTDPSCGETIDMVSMWTVSSVALM